MRGIVLLLAGLMLLAPAAGCLAPEFDDFDLDGDEHIAPNHDFDDDDHDEDHDEVDEHEDEHDEEQDDDVHGDGTHTEHSDDDHGDNGHEEEDVRAWYCDSSGTGGHHTDPAYEGHTKGALDDYDCQIVGIQFEAALAFAMQWPTLGEAEDDGWHMTVPYVQGMGTHHMRNNGFWIDGNDEFNPDDPYFNGTTLDEYFDYGEPEFLMYDGNDRAAKLVGFAWYVKSDPDQPPEGFAGDNDWWHRHMALCFFDDRMLVIGEDISDEECTGNRGTNVDLSHFWMAHAWIVEPWLQNFDVFANHHPCLLEDGPVYDEDDQCWMDAMHGAEHDGHGEHGSDDSEDASGEDSGDESGDESDSSGEHNH